jgi:hypothetical protein
LETLKNLPIPGVKVMVSDLREASNVFSLMEEGGEDHTIRFIDYSTLVNEKSDKKYS